MTFTKMENGVPEVDKKSLRPYFEEFMNMNTKVVRVNLTDKDYKSPKIAYTVFKTSIKRFGYPIDCLTRKNEIYFVRTDM